MRTERSKKLAAEFRAKGQPARKTIVFEGTLPADPATVFATLCPSRERDWIPGWKAKLIFTESGYAEENCVFCTPEANVSGPGVWVCTRYEPPRRIDWTRFVDHLVVQLTIELNDRGDGTTDSTWTATLTAVDRQGRLALTQVPDDAGDTNGVIEMLQHYLKTGEMVEAAAAGASGHGHGHGHGRHNLWAKVRGHLGVR